MALTPEQIEQWLAEPSELRHLEFKEAKTQFDRTRLYEYCVAIANEGGGHLVLGIADKPRRVTGTAAFENHASIEYEVLQKTGIRITVDAVDHPDGRVVACSIPSRPPGAARTTWSMPLPRRSQSFMRRISSIRCPLRARSVLMKSATGTRGSPGFENSARLL